jgi:hypothetical protein
MTRLGYVKVTIALQVRLLVFALRDTYVGQIRPLLNTETYRSILPPNAPALRFISDLNRAKNAAATAR